MVADALSRRSYAFTSAMLLTQRPISYDLQMMKIELKNLGTHVKITNIRLESTLIDKVKAVQATYSELMNEEGSRGRYSRSKNR